jgi:hypothetical protein
LVHHLHCYRPLPRWAGYAQSEEIEIPPEELIPVRGRFHAVPTRPVFAPKPRVAAPVTGEPTPAKAPLPEPEEATPTPVPLQAPIPMQAPKPKIPMQAPAQGRTAAAGAEAAPAGAAIARSASRAGDAADIVPTLPVEASSAEAGPALPPSHIATGPVEDPWRRRGGATPARR